MMSNVTLVIQLKPIDYSLSKSVEPRMKLRMRLLLHQFCLTLLSERGESNKTNANKVSYEAPLTRKTRLKIKVCT